MEPATGFLTRAQVRDLDRRAIEEFGVPGVVLMENAGRGAADLLLNLGIHGRVLMCCGKGNNGGDGFVIARHLANRGVNIQVLLSAPPGELTGDALINYTILKRGKYPLRILPSSLDGFEEELARSEWVVDALFGTGFSGPVRPPFDRIIEAINARPNHVLAVDIPSGLDCDTGQPLGPTIRAEHTVTFIAPKRGFAKRSIVINRHKTSISIEDVFWTSLREIARERGTTLSDLVASIDAGRGPGTNLSSAIRVSILDHYRKRLEDLGRRGEQTGHADHGERASQARG